MKIDICTRGLILLFLATVTIYGCERIEKQQTVRLAKGDVTLGGTLRIPLKATDYDVRPEQMISAELAKVGVHIFEGLVRLDPETSEVIPGIAESWSKETATSSYVFRLRENALFHDHEIFENANRGITAADVVHSFEQLATNAEAQHSGASVGRIKGAESFRNGTAASIDGLTAIDDYTVKITLNRLDESFLYLLAQPSMGITPKSIENNSVAVSAGPFRFAQDAPNIILARNADYHLDDEFGNHYPYIDTLIFVPVGSNTEKLEAFFEGRIDVITDLELDPVRSLLEQHVADFSGKNPRYIMKRETENASYETYTIYRAEIKGLGSGFMGYHDLSRVQIEQQTQ